MSSSLDLSQRLLDRGFAPIPVGPNKAPVSRNWVRRFAQVSKTLEEWFSPEGRHPRAYVGLVTGSKHPDRTPPCPVVVVDIDNKDGGASERLREFVSQGWPKTLLVQTPSGGFHLYYRDPGGVRTVSDWLPGVDVRGDGGQVVAFGQTLPAGEYRLMVDQVPASLPDDKVVELPGTRGKFRRPKGVKPPLPELFDPTLGLAAAFELPEVVPEGRRDDTFFRYAASLQARGVPREAAKGKLEEAYFERVLDKVGFSLAQALDKVDQVYGRYGDPAPVRVPSPPEEVWKLPAQEVEEALGSESNRRALEMLEGYLRRYALDLQTGKILDLRTRQTLSLRGFNYMLVDTVEFPPKEGSRKPVLVSLETLFRRQRMVVSGRKFLPHQPQFTPDGPHFIWNLWDAPEVVPEEGEVGPILRHLEIVVEEREAREYLLDWLAFLVQHPGEKVGSSILMSSDEQGVGKSFIADLMAQVLGAGNLSTITGDDLASTFNDYAEGKILVVAEEVKLRGAWQLTNKLKHYITGKTLRINCKFQPAYEIPNFTNFLFFSNHADAAHIESATERRTLVTHTYLSRDQVAAKEGLDAQEYYGRLFAWMRSGGAAAFAWYLKSRDISQFRAWGRFNPPETAAKRFARESSRSPFEEWLDLGLETCEGIFSRDVLTYRLVQQAAEAAGFRYGDREVHELRRWLKKHSSQSRESSRTVTFQGRTHRVKVIRNHSKWDEAPPAALVAELEGALKVHFAGGAA